MDTYSVIVTEFADNDLLLAENFYELQAPNLGTYFFDTLIADIESLSFYGGVHAKYFGLYRMLAKRFPYAIYYDIKDNTVVIYAVLDLRANPLKNHQKIQSRN